MAIRHFDGFSRYNGSGTNGGLRSTYNIQNTDNYFNTSATTRSGTGQSLFINGDVQFNPRELSYDWGVSDTNFGVGFAFRMPDVYACSTRSSSLFVSLADGASRQVGLRLLSDGRISICRVGGTFGGAPSIAETLATSSFSDAVRNGVWHFLEWSGTIDNTTGSSTLKLDGKVIASASGVNTQTTGNPSVSAFLLDNFNLTAGDWNLDDLYITDGALLGDCRVETLTPNADTATADFTPLGGGANYVEVDELPTDGDTSYVESTTVGHQDLYECTDLAAEPATIFAVKVAGHIKKDDTGPRTGRLLLKSGATTDEGADFSPNDVDYLSFQNIYETDPNTASEWTFTNVNALQIGVKVQS